MGGGGRLAGRLLRLAGSAGDVAAAVGTRCRAQSASTSIWTRSFAAGVAPLARCPGGDETWFAVSNRRRLRRDPTRIERLRWFGTAAPVELDDDDHDANHAAASSPAGSSPGGVDPTPKPAQVDVWRKEDQRWRVGNRAGVAGGGDVSAATDDQGKGKRKNASKKRKQQGLQTNQRLMDAKDLKELLWLVRTRASFSDKGAFNAINVCTALSQIVRLMPQFQRNSPARTAMLERLTTDKAFSKKLFPMVLDLAHSRDRFEGIQCDARTVSSLIKGAAGLTQRIGYHFDPSLWAALDPVIRRTAPDMNVYEAANAMWSYGMLFESGAFPALSGETLKALTEASARVIKGDTPVNNVNDIMWAYLRIYQYGDGQASYDFGPLDTDLLQALCEKVILHGKADGWELKVVPLGIAMRAYNKMYDIGAVSELGEKMADRMISETSRLVKKMDGKHRRLAKSMFYRFGLEPRLPEELTTELANTDHKRRGGFMGAKQAFKISGGKDQEVVETMVAEVKDIESTERKNKKRHRLFSAKDVAIESERVRAIGQEWCDALGNGAGEGLRARLSQCPTPEEEERLLQTSISEDIAPARAKLKKRYLKAVGLLKFKRKHMKSEDQ